MVELLELLACLSVSVFALQLPPSLPQVNRVLTRLLEERPPPVEKLPPRLGESKPLWVSWLLHAEHAMGELAAAC